MNYEDYICGTRFQKLANIEIDNKNIITNNNKNINDIVYCHTHNFNNACFQIPRLFRNNKPTDIILITHNSDGSVRSSREGQAIRENDADASLLPPNVIKWYAQNVECSLDSNPKIVPIPIGLENRYCFPYDKAEMLFKMRETVSEELQDKIYCNFNVETNIEERTACLKSCLDFPSLCFLKLRKNGEDYQSYLQDIASHNYIACPRGNGLDCHRTYEALYLGATPVMTKIPSIESFELPIIFIENWKEIGLVLFYNREPVPLHKSLSMNYWRDRIQNAT